VTVRSVCLGAYPRHGGRDTLWNGPSPYAFPLRTLPVLDRQPVECIACVKSARNTGPVLNIHLQGLHRSAAVELFQPRRAKSRQIQHPPKNRMDLADCRRSGQGTFRHLPQHAAIFGISALTLLTLVTPGL
jgi:hypothetical protein